MNEWMNEWMYYTRVFNNDLKIQYINCISIQAL